MRTYAATRPGRSRARLRGALVRVDEDAIQHLVDVAGGDARNALNALELAVEPPPKDATGAVHITLEMAQESIQRRAGAVR